MKSPPVRIIVAEPDETATIMDNNNVDEMGVEDLEGADTNNDSEYCNNACMKCGRKDCKGKDSCHPSWPCQHNCTSDGS
jgi:hypothetical protein